MIRKPLSCAEGKAPYVAGEKTEGDLPLAVSGGGGHTCAVAEGGMDCWGFNKSGQLGDRTNLDSLTPVKVEGLTVPTAG